MKVTIVTLYRDWLAEHYVGAVKGSISKTGRIKLRRAFKLQKDDEMFFSEVEVQDKASKLNDLLNIDGGGHA